MKHYGSCHCGGVNITSYNKPMIVVQCNCQSCRKLTGSVSVSCLFDDTEIEFSGATNVYQFEGGSGQSITVHFCETCNSRSYYYFDVFEGLVIVPIGCFDNVKQLKPKLEIWTSEKLSWLEDDGCIQLRIADSGMQERLEAMLAKLND